jgi:UDP-N-acetylmuramate dehydrogenase
MNWWKHLKGKVRLQEPLKYHTTFKIGGPAKFFLEPKDTGDLKALLNLLRRGKISFLLIGAGSNLLISDKGVDKAVLSLRSPYFQRIHFKNTSLEVAAGAMLNRVVLAAQRHGLSGLEFLAGIPGTIGGALVMNAGITEKGRSPQSPSVRSIGDLIEKVIVMDYNGNIKTLDKKDIEFGYRESSLAKYIILGARLKLVKKNKKEIKNRIQKYINYRKGTQDATGNSAGCIFKNPRGYSAGKLIDLCDLKGKKIGDASVSRKHANFILNTGQARAQDVFKLMDLIRERVKDRFNITLKSEIKIWQ